MMRYILSILILVALASDVQSQSIPAVKSFCRATGEIAQSATRARDSGTPIEQLYSKIDTASATPDALEFFKRIVSVIYTMDGVDAVLARQVVTQMCEYKYMPK